MADIVKNLIEYVGISDDIPENSTVFKQFNIEKIFCLPDVKPDIEQIVKVMTDLEIKSTKVIKTPKSTSLEGQILTGWKMIVEGVIKQKVQYVADQPTQPVHAAHIDIPFSTFIVLPENFIIGTPVTVEGFIEDVYVMAINKRFIFSNTTIILSANFC